MKIDDAVKEYKMSLKNMKQFKVGLAVGGVMEHPDYEYTHIEKIMAHSEKEAIEKYEAKHPRLAKGYWSVSIVGDRI